MAVVVKQVAVVVVLRGEAQPAGDAGVGIHIVADIVGSDAVLQYRDAVAEEVELVVVIDGCSALETDELTDGIVAVGLGAVGVEGILALGDVADGVIRHLQVQHLPVVGNLRKPAVVVVGVGGGDAVGVGLGGLLSGGIVLHRHYLVSVLQDGGNEVAGV